MSEKRRDNRNRILREGEYQRKDGRYRFRYIDEDGKEKNVYSWRLDKNDPMPKGKKREPSLREKEKQIEADLFDRIVTNGGNYTVLELVEKYVSLKTGVRHNTVAGYKTVINMLKKESFGNLRIDKVRLSDAKAWLIKLQQIDGRGYSSIHSIRGVLRPAFQMAVDDDLLRKNPFEFELASVIVNDSVTREAITRKQQRDLLKFIQEDKHFSRYYDAIYILFHTGLRISEFCGLTISEIEFGEMRIKVDHQLQRTAQMQYVIEEPKTDKGIRYVPMTEAVAACFRRIIANRKTPKVEPMVEGYAGFLFLDKNDMPMVALHWEKYMEHIIQKYNRIYRIQMIKVLFVCHGNICRSPMAEFIFKDMVSKQGLSDRFYIASAATSTEEIWNGIGNPVYPPAREELAKHGIDCKGKRAVQLTKADYDKYDYILGMDHWNLKNMLRILKSDPEDKVKLLLDYSDDPRDIADPWYTGGFDVTYSDVVEGCEAFLEYLKDKKKL